MDSFLINKASLRKSALLLYSPSSSGGPPGAFSSVYDLPRRRQMFLVYSITFLAGGTEPTFERTKHPMHQ
jgi:hypothetical protein